MSTGLMEGQGMVLWPSYLDGCSEPATIVPMGPQEQPWTKQTPGAQGTESPHRADTSEASVGGSSSTFGCLRRHQWLASVRRINVRCLVTPHIDTKNVHIALSQSKYLGRISVQ